MVLLKLQEIIIPEWVLSKITAPTLVGAVFHAEVRVAKSRGSFGILRQNASKSPIFYQRIADLLNLLQILENPLQKEEI